MFKPRNVFETDPKHLDLERLCIAHEVLLSKLVNVNAELESRMHKLSGSNGSEPHRDVFGHCAHELSTLNSILQNVLDKGLGKPPRSG